MNSLLSVPRRVRFAIFFFILCLFTTLPPMISSSSEKFENDEEFLCLVENIYFESKGESMRGKIAVGVVTLNRLKDPRYPKTLCEVVKQGPIRESWKTRSDPNLASSDRIFLPIRHRCQFSWWCDGYKERISYNEQWTDSIQAARSALSGRYNDLVGNATHYHAVYVSPSWSNKLKFIVQIDNHRFYSYN